MPEPESVGLGCSPSPDHRKRAAVDRGEEDSTDNARERLISVLGLLRVLLLRRLRRIQYMRSSNKRRRAKKRKEAIRVMMMVLVAVVE